MNAGDVRARARAFREAHPARTATPAPDPGRILAEVPRADGTVLRVSVHLYEGKPFVRVAPWAPGEGGAWPVKGKGCTVRVRELAAVAEGLAAAMDAMAPGAGR